MIAVIVLAGAGIGAGLVGLARTLGMPRDRAARQGWHGISLQQMPGKGPALGRASPGELPQSSAPIGAAPKSSTHLPWGVDLHVHQRSASGLVGSLERLKMLVGAQLAKAVEQRHLSLGALGQWVDATGTSLEALFGEMALAGFAGMLIVPGMSAVMALGGVYLPVVVPIWGAIAAGFAGSLLPLAVIRGQAGEQRRHLRRASASFLDLVVLALAGGMGIEGALEAACSVSDDWAMKRIAYSLAWARDAGITPWSALAQLGRDTGVGELSELAASVGLAGSEGARIRESLTVKAASLRRHELAEEEASAASATERMFLPGVILLIGFLIFIGYPAVVRILVGL
ncbi:MAG: type II secretion system F family protein [Actinobacteria bacterium]|nr:type II secretion system F family protein [Actinomycetota bacterium]